MPGGGDRKLVPSGVDRYGGKPHFFDDPRPRLMCNLPVNSQLTKGGGQKRLSLGKRQPAFRGDQAAHPTAGADARRVPQGPGGKMAVGVQGEFSAVRRAEQERLGPVIDSAQYQDENLHGGRWRR